MIQLFRIVTPIILLGITHAYSAPDANATKSWPKGINPAKLLTNTDAEPDVNQPGFIELFNGKDLNGWSIQGGQMTYEVIDGAIVGTAIPGVKPNSFLCTDDTYDDFIFTAEFKWDIPSNSGIMFRADTKQPDKNGVRRVFGYQSEMDQSDRRWTGGIYGEGMGGWKYPLSKPQAHAAARAAIKDHSAWNRMTIYANGDVIKTWINGVPCSYLINDERSEGFFGLQLHTGPKGIVAWRNIKVKELNGSPEEPEGWTDLFADDDFSEWEQANGKDVGSGWTIKNGVVHRHSMLAGSIRTRQSYEDFELIFEWKISESGNSGIKYRTHKNLGPEYQVLDDINYPQSKPTHLAASLYDLVAADDAKPIKPVGEWNTGRIVADGNQLEHWLNGEMVASVTLGNDDWQRRFKQSKYKNFKNFATGKGPILLQDHNDEVWFRNMKVREL
ncbi:DUF1080 domain-containing protein [Rubellicoccus peritrichatus]|uniref:DUF1080 domain-containing protein n=1 Tax=Rubellicoccus peritrichatus TaxID=3080537 RepID=A0AAQ3L6H6_9BACT|nr:DUF1080 domain-containing protein [Puniceicoccus sp. CR14]WOO39971.1 DUF1080 domain-containing protein [Puniceicoccus sp. CR14]